LCCASLSFAENHSGDPHLDFMEGPANQTPYLGPRTSGFGVPTMCSLDALLEGDRSSSQVVGSDTWIGKGEVECITPTRTQTPVEVCYYAWDSKLYDRPTAKLGRIEVYVSNRIVTNGVASFLGEFQLDMSQLEPDPLPESEVTTLLATTSTETNRVTSFAFGVSIGLYESNRLAPGILVITEEGTPCQEFYDFSFTDPFVEIGSL
ncbi:MAG: hypothetical protein AAF202_14015, partial [Pseudomonadota bacterium]